MAGQKDDKRADRESREAKLAQALRANLRRRKATAAATPQPKPDKTCTD